MLRISQLAHTLLVLKLVARVAVVCASPCSPFHPFHISLWTRLLAMNCILSPARDRLND